MIYLLYLYLALQPRFAPEAAYNQRPSKRRKGNIKAGGWSKPEEEQKMFTAHLKFMGCSFPPPPSYFLCCSAITCLAGIRLTILLLLFFLESMKLPFHKNTMMLQWQQREVQPLPLLRFVVARAVLTALGPPGQAFPLLPSPHLWGRPEIA